MLYIYYASIKENKGIKNLSHNINQLLYSAAAENFFFSRVQGTFIKIGRVLGNIPNNTFKSIKILPIMFFDKIKFEIDDKTVWEIFKCFRTK